MWPNKTEITFMMLFGIIYCQTDNSAFFRSNSDLNLHCVMINHVHSKVSKYKMLENELISLGNNEAELIF